MKRIKLLVYGGLFFLLLNYPLASLFNKPLLIGSLPLMYRYLFGIWLLFIVVLYLVVEGSPKTETDYE